MLRDVRLPGPVHLTPSKWFGAELQKIRAVTTGMPTGLAEIVRDLATRSDGAPAIISTHQDKQRLHLHTYSYVVHLAPANSQDFFWVNKVLPLKMHDYATLTRGVLLLQCDWRPVAHPRELPDNATAHWDRLRQEWTGMQHDLAERNAVPRLKPEHAHYLDVLASCNDLLRQVEQATNGSQHTLAYRSVRVCGDHGATDASSYTFNIVNGRAPKPGKRLQIVGHGNSGGIVTGSVANSVTVRFDEPVDHERLPSQGELAHAPFKTADVQRGNAVETLRSRQSCHRTLLDVLVDHEVAPMTGRPDHPTQPLDPEQLTAFRRALSVQDLLVVLGPPGTGKTRVITEIVSATSEHKHGKTLVTAFSNKAVDNVLARIPREVVMIRVGRELDVNPDVRPNLLQIYAAELRQELANGSENRVQRYSRLHTARAWHAESGVRIAAWSSARSEQRSCATELDRCRRAVGGPAHQRVRQLDNQVDRLNNRVRRQQRRLNGITARAKATSADRGFTALLGRFRDWRLHRCQDKLTARTRALDECTQARQQAAAELEAVVRDDPGVQAAQRKFDAAAEDTQRRRTDALVAMNSLRTELLAIEPLPELVGTDDDELFQCATDSHAEVDSRLRILRARAELLADWHAEVESCPAAQLYPELIRYADVIGTTCIAAGSRSEIAAEDFDLVIVDEAGQARTSDVLIPLVRGRRAVLVGDDKQLPPVYDSALRDAIDSQGSSAALRLLTSASLLESLLPGLPSANVVSLRTQRRMPEVIARFVSTRFYQGTLRSDVPPPTPDRLFGSPLAFVDTACLPERDRREQLVGSELHSCRNAVEARLLNRLAEHYHRDCADWALVVPYQAQKEELTRLVGEWASPETVDANIGTVDAFQGGERDVILYGFTRSNLDGRVGFLKDLRRLNVAFTRAKQQLVLVGDLTTLHNADDPGVRELIAELYTALQSDGDLRSYNEVVDQLSQIGS